MNQTNAPLDPPRLVRYKAPLPRPTTTVTMTYDEAQAAANDGQKVWHARVDNGSPLSANNIARNFTTKDRFVRVEHGEPTPFSESIGGTVFRIGPNPKYDGEIILEVATTWPFTQMSNSPTVFEVAADLEDLRDAAALVGKIAVQAASVAGVLAEALESLGFLRDSEAPAETAKRGPGRPRKE